MRPRMLFVPATRRTRLAAVLLLVLLPLLMGLANAAPESVSGGVRFTYSDPAAGSVNWAGAFNNWSTSATPFAKGADGAWSVEVALPAGEHQYKFVINGTQWIGDPENAVTAGSDQNSMVKVGPDGKLVVQAAAATLKYNPKIGIGGRIRGLYESIYNPVTTRYELTRPTFDIDLAFDVKMSDVLKAHWLMNINPEQENVQDYRSRLNLKRGSLLVSQPNLSLLAFDSEGVGTWDDPLHLLGNIGPFEHPYGYQRQGVKLGMQRYGFDTEILYTDNFDDRLSSNSDLYQGYRIDNFPTFAFGPNQQSGITFEASDAAALLKAIALLQTTRTSPLSAPTPTFAVTPGQGAKVMTQDIGDNGKLFGYGDNAENMFALRTQRQLMPHLKAGLLGRTDRGFGFGRLAYAEPVGDSLVKASSNLYVQEWFGVGTELAWTPSDHGKLYGELLAGSRRMNFVNGSRTYIYKLSSIGAAGATPEAAASSSIEADGDHATLDKSVRFKLGGDWTMAQGDIGLHLSVAQETHHVPFWTQSPIALAGLASVDHVRFRTVDFQRAQYTDPNATLDNSATTLKLDWDRNWRYYLGREVKSSLDVEWINFSYDKRTSWEHQIWFPTGNFWLESGQSAVGIDRMTVLGEQQTVRIRPTIDIPLLKSRDMRFTWRGTFSGVGLDKQPRYAESIFQYGFDVNRTLRLNSDTRWAKYNAPALSLGRGYVSTYTEALFRLAPTVQFSLGWGVDPNVLDPNTNEYATIGRDVFLNNRNVNGFIAETNNLSLSPQIAAAERALRNVKRVQVQAIVHF